MVALKVTEFNLAAAFDGSEIFGLVQLAENVQTTLDDITTYVTTQVVGGAATLELIRDTIGTALVAGTGITVTVDDGADTITIACTITQYTDEMARDAIGTALVEGSGTSGGVNITVNDAGDTITIGLDSSAFQPLTDEATIAWDMSAGYNAKVTLGGNRILGTPTNPVEGRTYTLQIIQDGTGSRTITDWGVIDFGAAGNPILSTAAGSIDFIYLQCIESSGPTFRATFNGAA